MEWIKAIIKNHTKEDGAVDVEAANKEIKEKFPEHAVPKEQYNNVSNQLKEANKTVEKLEKSTKDNPDVQKDLESYKTKATKLENENKELKIKTQAESALRDAGAKDVDYALFKLGTLELDKDGKVKDLDNKLKDFQKDYPDQIESSNDDKKKEVTDPKAPGYKAVDNKLEGGKSKVAYSFDQLGNLTPQEVNDNWDAVQAALEQGGNE